MDNKEPKVKVVIKCITYNHGPYIRQALEGFVMQKTDFPFVAIVHDDASTDDTASIIREYAEKYPDIIKPIYETENQYSKGNGSVTRIMNQAILATGAPYVAVCEGDDYWTDPFKLQKQVDFLDTHPDYSLVFANVRIHDASGLSDETFPVTTGEKDPLTIYKGWCIPTLTIMYRKEVLSSTAYQSFIKIKDAVFGDLTLEMASTTIGKIHGDQNIVGVWRRLSTGASVYLEKHPLKFFKNRIAISKRFGREFKDVDTRYFETQFINAVRAIVREPNRNLPFIWRYLKFAPGHGCKLLAKLIIKRS